MKPEPYNREEAMKKKTMYVCQQCGAQSARWMGQCAECKQWNTLVEQVVESEKATRSRFIQARSARPLKISEVETKHATRIPTGSAELNRVLGGGLVPGSILLLGGDPGIGKSTLMLQTAAKLGSAVLYVTGEESLSQLRMRAERLGLGASEHVHLLAETDVDTVVSVIEAMQPTVVIIDSIQTMSLASLESIPGSVGQVRESAAAISRCGKRLNIPMVMVGHVTKDGILAGPKVLEHMVDAVLQFEGDNLNVFRILRALKNRYGSTNEIGVFAMEEVGLREVKNPSEIFLAERADDESGTVVTCTMEGTRPLLIEVQALVSVTSYGTPQRSATGFDSRRLQMILAVLEKRLGVPIGRHDVFINIAGGLRIDDPAADLAVAAAVLGSWRDRVIPSRTVVMGEVSLTGEIRSVSHIDQRLGEAAKLGFTGALIPHGNRSSAKKMAGMDVRPADRLVAGLAFLYGDNAE